LNVKVAIASALVDAGSVSAGRRASELAFVDGSPDNCSSDEQGGIILDGIDPES
jgi:hypothetical protein